MIASVLEYTIKGIYVLPYPPKHVFSRLRTSKFTRCVMSSHMDTMSRLETARLEDAAVTGNATETDPQCRISAWKRAAYISVMA
jgi:hypothetical protein